MLLQRFIDPRGISNQYKQHPPEFDFVQHAFGLIMGHTYQGLFVNGNELISRPQTSILDKDETHSSNLEVVVLLIE